MKAWCFEARFVGGSRYLSLDVRDTDPGWGNEHFLRPIERLAFFLPTGHAVVMSGYDQYNFFVEATERLSGKNCRLDAVWVCGAAGNRVRMYRIGQGRVVVQEKPLGREWGGGPTRGWKKGERGRLRAAVVRQG